MDIASSESYAFKDIRISSTVSKSLFGSKDTSRRKIYRHLIAQNLELGAMLEREVRCHDIRDCYGMEWNRGVAFVLF